MRILNLALAAAAIVGIATCQQPPLGCNGVKNTAPVLDLPAQPLKTVANGQSWIMQEGTNVVYIAKLKGTAYEMGYAYGQLFGPEMVQNFHNLRGYGRSKITELLGKLQVPEYMADYIYTQLEPLIFFLLDWNYQIALPFIPQRYIDEIKGMADGSNGLISELFLWRGNMVPELTQAACTVLGSFGSASQDGKLYHLRALDWEPTAPVNQFPSIIFYEPTEAGSKPFANIGYIALIGSLTAISKIGISVGEKVMYARAGDYPDPPRITYVGKPWAFVLRDTVQFADNIHDVQTMLQTTNRTMQIHLGYGSLPDKLFRGVDYASNFVTFYDDKNYTHYSQAHPQLDGIFYYNKFVQPSGDVCINSILQAQYGHVTPATMYEDVAGFHETGNAQVIVMDPEGQQIWAAWSQYGAPINAYERSPMHIKLSDFWGNTQDGFLE